jgi:Tfp pilus assembly protein PilW
MTLIEVTVAVGLSVGVLAAVGVAYTSQRMSQRYGTELAQVQGNGRIALDAIGRDIRQAGFVGCNSALQRFDDPRVLETAVVPEIVNGLAGGFTISARNAIRALRGDNTTYPWWTAAKPEKVVGNSHVIEIRYASLEGATRMSGGLQNAGQRIPTMGTFEPSRGDDDTTAGNRLGLLSDCQSALVVSVASVAAGQVNLVDTEKIGTVPCAHVSRVGSDCIYWPSATLYPIRVVQYYVAEFGTEAAPDRRLMVRKRIMSHDGATWNVPQEVMRGVNRLRVTGIGFDTTGTADPTFRVSSSLEESSDTDLLTTVPAADWARVVRLDLRLQMQASKGKQAGDAPVIRNFESSYTVRSRTATDPT